MKDDTREAMAAMSPWQRDLFTHLANHVQSERVLLEEYSTLAMGSQSKAFQYLVNLLIQDEIRHHTIFMELTDTLKAEAVLSVEDTAVPPMDFYRADPSSIIDVTNVLLAREEEDLAELKELQRKLREVKDVTLWSTLIDQMQRDTQKHIAILQFILAHSETKP